MGRKLDSLSSFRPINIVAQDNLSDGGEAEVVVDAGGAESEAGYLSVPVLREAPGFDVGARADRAGGRPLEAPPRPHGVCAESTAGGESADARRVARGRARAAAEPRGALAGTASG